MLSPTHITPGTQTGAENSSLHRLSRLDLIAAVVVGLAVLAFTFGIGWDIQWHKTVGRDRALTPPHLVALGSIAIAGLTSIIAILLDTLQARRGIVGDLRAGARMFRVFRAPLGLAVSGFGSLLAAIAFPLDNYWHVLYGVDVTLWAPFHVMLVAGMLMAGVGAVYVAADGLRGDSLGQAPRLTLVALLAITWATLMVFPSLAATEEGLARVGDGYRFALYPVMLAFAVPLAVTTALGITRRPGTATLLSLVFLALRQGMFLLMPKAMAYAIVAEGQTYRPGAPIDLVLLPEMYPVSVPAAAVVLDLVAWRARRWVLPVTVLLAISAGVVDRPWARFLPVYFPDLDTSAVLVAALPFMVVAALLGTGLAVILEVGLSHIPTDSGAQGDLRTTSSANRRLVAPSLTALFLLPATAGMAVAHGEEPLGTVSVRAGAYPLVVEYYSLARGGETLVFGVRPTPGAGVEGYTVNAVPGTTTNAVAVRAQLEPDPDQLDAVRGTVGLPVSGQWLLEVGVDGPYGRGYASAPILAGAPPTIPVWAGWLVSLIPVWATLGFIVARSRRGRPS